MTGTDVPELHPARWRPDEHLPDAALAGRVRATELDGADRAWLVAVLTDRGLTTDQLAERLHCSRRLVQQIRAEPLAVLTARLLAAEAAADKASRAARVTASASAVTHLVHEIDALKRGRGVLIDQLAELRRRCQQQCPPPQVIVLHPKPTRRRVVRVDLTIPLFQIEETEP